MDVNGDRVTGTGGVIFALLVAFCGIILISFFPHWYEADIYNTVDPSSAQVIVNALTPIVFFLFILLVGVVNPLLRRLLPALAMGYRELLFIMSLWLFTGVICFTNLSTSVLGTIGVLNSPAADTSTMRSVNIKSYLRQDIFLREEGSRDYYDGLSDGQTRILPLPASPLLHRDDFKDTVALAAMLRDGNDPLSKYLAGRLSPDERKALDAAASAYSSAATALRPTLVDELNRLKEDPVLRSEKVPPSDAAQWLEDVRNIETLAEKLQSPKDAASRRLRALLSSDALHAVRMYNLALRRVQDILVTALNRIIEGPSIYERDRFAQAALAGDTQKLINRLLIEGPYPDEISPSPMPVPWNFILSEIKSPAALAARLRAGKDPASIYIWSRLPADARQLVENHFALADKAGIAPTRAEIARSLAEATAKLRSALLDDLNATLKGPCIFEEKLFEKIELPETIRGEIRKSPQGDDLIRVNRTLLEQAYSVEILTRTLKGAPLFVASDFRNLPEWGKTLKGDEGHALHSLGGGGPLSAALYSRFSAPTRQALERYVSLSGLLAGSQALEDAIVGGINAVQQGPCLYDEPAFGKVILRSKDQRLVNRLLLVRAYGEQIKGIPPSVPWPIWWRPLAFWAPLMLVMIVFSASLVRMVHRQWSKHELLTYPLAEVTASFMRSDQGRAFPAIFYNRIFWIGFALVSFVFIINGLNVWFPTMIRVPTYFDQRNIILEFPFLKTYCGREAYALFRGWVYPMIICIMVLLPTELSLTSWLGFAMMILGTGFYFRLTGESIGDTETGHIQYGMYFAMAAVILIIGRREYVNIFRRAFTFRRTDDPSLSASVNACRIFILAAFAFGLLMSYAGLDWVLSTVTVLSFALVVLLIARMTAELGHPWLVNFGAVATNLPLKLLGSAAMGPKGLANMALVQSSIDNYAQTTNTIAAQETTIQKINEKPDGFFSRSGLTLIMAVGVCVAISATTFFTLWDNYSYGARQENMDWGNGALDVAAGHVSRLDLEGKLDTLTSVSGLERFSYMKTDWRFWRFFLYGAAAVGIFAAMRLRFTWWPFHPLPLLFMNTWAMSRTFFPIFLGWVIKMALLKIGGGRVFARSKPFFIGAIAGQIMVGGLWVIVAVIYYLVTHSPPKRVSIFI